MNNNLLNLLVCPLCKGKLRLTDDKSELICPNDRLAFPIRNNVPVMLEEEAREITIEEVNNNG